MRETMESKHTLEFSCNYAIDEPHWDEDGPELEQLLYHCHTSKSNLDCHGLLLYTCQSMYPLLDGHNSS